MRPAKFNNSNDICLNDLRVILYFGTSHSMASKFVFLEITKTNDK